MPDPAAIMPVTATVAGGKLAGRAEAGVATFRGVPYAAPPVGTLRFAPPAPHPRWTGPRDATRDGPCPPQLPSRLEKVMGRVDFAQGEDCLTLTIATPLPLDAGAKRPVMVWFHGGAWMSGAGSLSLYSGAEMARAGGVVVIGVNYRLGALGYLDVDGMPGSGSGANFGLLDHVAALRWVGDNIAAFGGDPGNVTVFGQSAGGGSIAALMQMPGATKLFRRAILQSAALMPYATRESARKVTDEVLKALNLDRALLVGLREVPAEKMLDAQRTAVMALARPSDPTPLYRMVRDGAVLADDPPGSVAAGNAAGIDIMIGTTRDEMHAFFAGNEALAGIDRATMAKAIRRTAGDKAEAVVEACAKRHPGVSAPLLFAALRADDMFRLPSLRFAEAQGKHARTYVYRFDWQPTPDALYGAAHCIELPFMFGNLADWDAAAMPPPMLANGNRAEMQRLAKAMQGAWTAFARTGNPNHKDMPEWKPWTREARHSMVFDAETRAATNLDDEIEKAWRG